ncbi:plasmid pRiA4b ORF-3 family protein [Streptomyces sp. NPDC012510]|uniref:plasmid pRiA4b ORF-3 family protein n=1 Tax=Streptomyces sp. NPDC012510 TaxID=3364838 RepID=UPI0036EB53C3
MSGPGICRPVCWDRGTRRAGRRRGTGTAWAAGPPSRPPRITSRDSRPPIWRRLEVPSGITLRELHDVIQAAFGWEDYHMWAFESGRDRYGVADRDLGIRNAASKRLGQVAPHTGDRLRYTYDFGDDWEHDILVEDVTAPEAGTAYPRCLTGRRACPPEDCGGIWGYDYLIEILADPRHERTRRPPGMAGPRLWRPVRPRSLRRSSGQLRAIRPRDRARQERTHHRPPRR